MAHRQQEWNEMIADMLGTRPDDISTDNYSQIRLHDIRAILMHSPTGQTLLNWADKNNVAVWMDSQAVGFYGCVYPDSNTVILNAAHTDVDLASTLAHEIQHVYQDSLSLLSHTVDDIPTHVIHATLAEAGAYAIQGQVISELRDYNEDYFDIELMWKRSRCVTSIQAWESRADMRQAIFNSFLLSKCVNVFKSSFVEEAVDYILERPPSPNFKSGFPTEDLSKFYNNAVAPARAKLSPKLIQPYGQFVDGSNFLPLHSIRRHLDDIYGTLFEPLGADVLGETLFDELKQASAHMRLKQRLNP